MSVQIILWIIACVLFAIEALAGPRVPARFNLTAAGLAFTVAGLLAGVL